MTLRSNPRILLVYLFLPLVVAAGIAAPFLIGLLFGLIALAVALYFSWSIFRLTRRQLATRVETLTDELLFVLHGDEKVSFPWNEIRVTGIALIGNEDGEATKKGRRLFVYRETDDKMFALTDEFERLDELAAELRGRTDFREIVLAPAETLKDRLRELVGPPPHADNG